MRHPAIRAAGFTGSRSGGLALMAAAAARPQPIPVFAEMSSINPLILLPGALAARGAELATGFAASLTLGVGQFCTNPGLVLGLAGAEFDRFTEAAVRALATVPPAPMLPPGIAEACRRGAVALGGIAGVSTLLRQPVSGCEGAPALFLTRADRLLAEPGLTHEVFGPASLLVACRDLDELAELLEHLEGQLTATLQLQDDDAGDRDAALRLLPLLERKVGRVLVNGFPTGVELAHAMVHGGPFPATSYDRSTSVGTAAIGRFLRPVCDQNLPSWLLPAALRDDAAEARWHGREGRLPVG